MIDIEDLPKPPAWSEEFRIIGEDEIIKCECGQESTLRGMGTHSRSCKLAAPSVSKESLLRRGSLAEGRCPGKSKYYTSRSQADEYLAKYTRVCKKLRRRRHCEACGKLFYTSYLSNNNCSKACGIKTARSKANYAERGVKTSATRIANRIGVGNTAWNKGLSGDEYLSYYRHNGETLDETKARILAGFFTKSSIEETFEKLLIKNNIDYENSVFVARRQFDFKLTNRSILVEVDGCYWHGNLQRFPELTDRQLLKQTEDRAKDVLAKSYGYTILRFWEIDIQYKLEEIEELLNRILNGAEDEVNEAVHQVEVNYTSKGGENIRHYSAR